MLSQHSSASNEHYTPVEIIEAARATMGGIDLDPATTAPLNARTVKATHFFTTANDGLSRAWRGRVWLNPPGGKTKNKSNAALWWEKLMREYHSGRVTQAIFLGFSLEILTTTQDGTRWPAEFAFCVPRRRIQFLQFNDSLELEAGSSPTHGNLIVYVNPNRERDLDFQYYFEKFGKVRI